jgi:folate-binding protein YgfZ
MADALPNPLFAAHQQAEAEFQPYANVQIVTTFGQPQAEYSAIHKACGMMDLPQRGIIELAGEDRLTFLNNLLTNQTFDKQTKQPLPIGTGVYAFLLNAKTGRIIVDVNVLELGERTLLELDARLIHSVLETLDRYRFAEQVKFASRVGELHEITLHGPGARSIIEKALDTSAAIAEPITCGAGRIMGNDVIVWRDDPCGVLGFHLIVPTGSAHAIWDHLLIKFGTDTQLGKRDLRAIGWATFNACRIEAGRPIFGIDFDDEILPAETGQMRRAVSLTKGCYPGQEIVARMHARQQVAKQLIGFKMDDEALPIAGAQIYDVNENGVGVVTSSTISPILSGAVIGLGFVKKPLFAIGSKLIIPAEGQMRGATVVETPFISAGKTE